MGLLGNFAGRLKHAWSAFSRKGEPAPTSIGPSAGYLRPDRTRLSRGNERSIINAFLTRIAIDAAAVSMNHVRTDENGNFIEVIHSDLDYCLNVEANIDQAGRAFRQDMVLTLLNEGVIAVVPTKTTDTPTNSNAYDVKNMRVGKIVEWFPEHVRVNMYNEDTGNREDFLFPKKLVAIIENPLYSVMNEPNSTLKRLIRKINLLDAIDEQSGSGKLDMIIQLPYALNTPAKKAQAEERRKSIEAQIADSKLGIAYIDATEHITQINRPLENNLMTQIQYLTDQLFAQIGLTAEVFNGTADERVMLNYMNRTIEPILSAIAEELKRKFLSKTARTQLQSIMFFKDQFRLMTMDQVSNIANSLCRNEVLTPNEVRGILGFKPSEDPNADELRNRNIAGQTGGVVPEEGQAVPVDEYGQNEVQEPYQEELQPQEEVYYPAYDFSGY